MYNTEQYTLKALALSIGVWSQNIMLWDDFSRATVSNKALLVLRLNFSCV